MHRNLILIFILISCINNLSAQDSIYVNDVLVLNERNSPTGEGGLGYEFSNIQVLANLNGTPLQFKNNLQYIRYEQSFSKGWLHGFTTGITLHGLLGGSTIINDSKYKLKGFRGGMRLGYKLRIGKIITIEPNTIVQYGNLRVTEKNSKNKIKSHGLNLAANLDTRIIVKSRNFQDMTIGISGGYMLDAIPHVWVESKKSDYSLNAEKINWSGFYFGMQIMFVD